MSTAAASLTELNSPGDGQTSPAPPSRRKRKTNWKHYGWLAFFLLPSAVPLMIFVFRPMISSLWISLHEWNLISDMQWVGFSNYTRLLSSERTWDIVGHTLLYIVGYLPIVYFGGLALAVLLNQRIFARAFFRSAYFLPVITSWVVVALVWQWLLNPSNGLVNQVLGFLNLPQPGWWTDPTWAMPSVIIASAWKDLGFVMVILLAGLQAVPNDVIEAAKIDGTNAWQRFWRVTFPLLSPSTFFVIVISLINGFQVFDQVYMMTGGGPSGSSQVIVGQIYDLTFRYGRAGEASALSWILFLIIMLVTAFQLVGQKKWVHSA
jgi:multiple sugar transport system permease protein